MSDTFQNDVEALYALADGCESLAVFMPALGEMLSRNSAALTSVTNAYRLVAADTGYTYAFALRSGIFELLSPTEPADVTVTGKEANLLAVFKRTLNPATALLMKKIRVQGSKAALLKLFALI